MTRFVEKMRELRPVVETGYENILLARLLVEEVSGYVRHTFDCP